MKLFPFNLGHSHVRFRSIWISPAMLSLLFSVSCHKPRPVTIAVIPRTSGTLVWEPEHRGAEDAAEGIGAQIYWNAPTREDDVAGQIALVEHVIARNYRGLILAPSQSLALITPVRRALAHGLPIVIISSSIPVLAGDNLFYILNDEEEGGRIAARRVAKLLHGQGTIAILGINPDVEGIMERAHSFDHFLAQNDPGIHVVERHMGSFNVPHEQEVAEEALEAHPDLDAIVTMMWPSARGAMSTIDNNPGKFKAKVVSFDPEDISFTSPSLDSVVVQNTRAMGNLAVKRIHARLGGESVPALTTLEPVLVTRANANSEEVRHMTTMDWNPGWSLSHTR
jgi:ribose transport system substrate-binding protein